MDEFILNANRMALDYVQAMDFPKAWASLKSAESRLSSKEAERLPNRLKLLALTYNNFSCYFKRKMRLEDALHCLSQALVLETQNADAPTAIAATHLNICAVYSDMKDHQSALTHAQFARDLLTRFATEESDISNLVIAYYNAAAEMEHLSMHKPAQEIYRQGFTISEQKLGPSHPLTEKLSAAIHPPHLSRPRTSVSTSRMTPINDRPFTPFRPLRLKESLSSPKTTVRSFEKKELRCFRRVLSMKRMQQTPERTLRVDKTPTISQFATIDDCLSTVKKIQTILEGRRRLKRKVL